MIQVEGFLANKESLEEIAPRSTEGASLASPHRTAIPGFRSITSGATVFGVDEAENRHAQHTLLDANVLHRVAGSLARDLESPFFNGIKVFWGGPAGKMTAEIRVNGEPCEEPTAAESKRVTFSTRLLTET